jgi:hypothetical protein
MIGVVDCTETDTHQVINVEFHDKSTRRGYHFQDHSSSVVVSTSNGLLRFFTASGVQRYIWRLGEDVVTMAAGRDGLIVVYREGGTSLDGTSL